MSSAGMDGYYPDFRLSPNEKSLAASLVDLPPRIRTPIKKKDRGRWLHALGEAQALQSAPFFQAK